MRKMSWEVLFGYILSPLFLITGLLIVDICHTNVYNRVMVVFDSSTLILLEKIEMLELFITDFHDRVIIPKKVETELIVKGREETPLISTLIREDKVVVLKVKNHKLVKKLMADFNIGAGEAEALSLALQEGTNFIATDDRNAIRACKALRLDFITAIVFLVRAFEKQLIDNEEALLKINKLKLFGRYSKIIIEDAKERIRVCAEITG